MDRPRSPVVLALLAGLLATAVVAVVSTSGQAAATAAPDPGILGVDVGGTGRASGVPDVLRFTVGVEVTAPTVDGAVRAANAAQARVIAELKERGVAARDVQTASVRVDPRYDDKGQRITGYVVTQDVRVTVRDLRKAGATMSAAVAAGGDAARLHGVAFELEDDEALRREARDAAFADAKAKAEQYARLADRSLGAVQSIREDVRPPSPPYPVAEMARAADAVASFPIEPGSSEVTVDVQVRWALG